MDRRAFSSVVNAQLAGRPMLMASKLRAALIRVAEENAEPLAKVLVDKALGGDLPAIKEMLDRGVGKAMQQVDVTTNGKDLPVPILLASTSDEVSSDNSD